VLKDHNPPLAHATLSEGLCISLQAPSKKSYLPSGVKLLEIRRPSYQMRIAKEEDVDCAMAGVVKNDVSQRVRA
jgi:hypothetical protein